MKKLAVIGALGLMTSGLFAQGLTPPSDQTKDSWEEINFEFNSSILSDGYPSLLRLADLLREHRDYHVRVVGNTDYVGSARYNDRLAMARAEEVKKFLVKYGALPDQITTAGNGKRDPEVNNRTKEGRFMNRRVVLTVTNAQGAVIGAGGIGDILGELQKLEKKQEECCDAILKRLDKLDDILAAVQNLKGENAKLQNELNDLRNQHNKLAEQVAGLPKPLSEQQTTNIANAAANTAAENLAKRNKKFSLLGLNVGPTFGPPQARRGDFTFSGSGQFFSPFGYDGKNAVQAQGEFMYYPGDKEGQFDVGLVNRYWKNLQLGGFASFKVIDFDQFQQAGWMGQADFLADYIFSRGRIGAFITRGFKNDAVLSNTLISPGLYLQDYARIVNQQGIDFLVGAWGDAYFQGDLAYLKMRETTRDARPGGNLELVQPITPRVAFTLSAGYNETYIDPHGSGEVKVGVLVGNYIKPKDYGKVDTPVPMDVPRIRYEFATRRVGTDTPVANAGANQVNVPAGMKTLNGSGSYDPLGETLRYVWTQISGPTVTLSSPNTAITTFSAAAGQTYIFRLTVTNADGRSASATTTVSTQASAGVQINSFTGTPASINAGQAATLSWSISNGTSATISPMVGKVNATTGSVSVTPTQTTTYTLTATGANGEVTATVTIEVGTLTGNPQIIRFAANPLTIQPGGQSTLSWTTSGATNVTISGVGSVTPNGSTTVSPSKTTTYVLTATSADGHSVTAPVTITVAPGTVPQVVTFVANPPTISAGSSTKLCWQVTGATSITITPAVGSNLNANDCATVSPTTTTTYTLTAVNATGQIQANATVFVGQVQILSFTANPVTSTAAGNPVVLSWTTANAQTVVLTGADVPAMTLQPNGSITVSPITNETYTLTAYGAGGTTVSVTISVFVR